MRDMKKAGAEPAYFNKTFDLQRLSVAGELGFEPRLTESESAVLPLNYSPTAEAPRI